MARGKKRGPEALAWMINALGLPQRRGDVLTRVDARGPCVEPGCVSRRGSGGGLAEKRGVRLVRVVS